MILAVVCDFHFLKYVLYIILKMYIIYIKNGKYREIFAILQ